MQRTHLPANLIDTPGLPTYRQINYWCQGGALGPDKISTGSGHRRAWTAFEILKLQTLNGVAKAFGAIGFKQGANGGRGVPLELVSRVWRGLDESSIVVLEHGPMRLTITLKEEAPMNVKSVKHNHITRDIKARGTCPACDDYWDKHEFDHQNVRETSNQQKPRRIITHDSGGGPGVEPGPIDDA